LKWLSWVVLSQADLRADFEPAWFPSTRLANIAEEATAMLAGNGPLYPRRMLITDSELALAAAEAGAAVVRSLYGSSLERFDKSMGDFATSADVAAEQAILEVLRQARPGDAVQGEETGRTGTGQDRVWLVDPLCGTLNYAVHTPLVAVNVALSEHGAVTAAASVDPLAGEAFWTDGTGAWRRTAEGDTPLAPSADSFLVEVNLDPPFPTLAPTSLLANPLFGEVFRPRVISSTLGLVWLAAGRRAAYLTDGGDLRDSVHFAAGIAICRAAGCVVTGIGGHPLDTGAGGLLAAADAETHRALLAIIR
jgi:myo-inositol-1(or 4)-monophosphatase